MRVRRKRKSFYIDKIGRKVKRRGLQGPYVKCNLKNENDLAMGKTAYELFSLEGIAVWGTHGRKTFSMLEAVRGDQCEQSTAREQGGMTWDEPDRMVGTSAVKDLEATWKNLELIPRAADLFWGRIIQEMLRYEKFSNLPWFWD